MRISIAPLFTPRRVIHAHCDLPCGVYNPAQARIEAESVIAIQEKYQDPDASKQPSETADEFRQRCVLIKEERAELVKHHLWVLWTDYFTPEHLERHPDLHEVFWNATKEAGEAKKSTDPEQGQRLLELIERIDAIFREAEEATTAA